MIVQKSGKIINIASMFGLVGYKFALPYCVSKGGVIQMTKALALEWAKYNIQVNVLCPGFVITPMNEKYVTNQTIYKQIINNTPDCPIVKNIRTKSYPYKKSDNGKGV